MIRGSTGRFLTLIMAPLIVVAVTALVMLPRRGGDRVKVSADGPVVKIDSPRSNARMALVPVEIVAKASDPDGLTTAELRVDGKRVTRVNLKGASDETVRFTWKPERAGEYELAVRARDLNGSWGAAAEVTVRIESDEVALPPPPTTVAPTPATDATTLPLPPPTEAATTLVPSTTGEEDSTESTFFAPLFPARTPAPGTTPTTGRPGTTPPTPGIPGPTPAPTPVPEPGTTPPTAPPPTIPPCVVPNPSIIVPRNGATEVPTRPTFTWTITGATCTPFAQELQVFSLSRDIYGRAVAPVRIQIALAGSSRSYTLTRMLPACTQVTAYVLAYDDLGIRKSSSKNFVTTLTGCPPLPTTTTEPPTTTTTEPPTTTTEPPPTTTTTTEPPTTLPPPP